MKTQYTGKDKKIAKRVTRHPLYQMVRERAERHLTERDDVHRDFRKFREESAKQLEELTTKVDKLTEERDALKAQLAEMEEAGPETFADLLSAIELAKQEAENEAEVEAVSEA